MVGQGNALPVYQKFNLYSLIQLTIKHSNREITYNSQVKLLTIYGKLFSTDHEGDNVASYLGFRKQLGSNITTYMHIASYAFNMFIYWSMLNCLYNQLWLKPNYHIGYRGCVKFHSVYCVHACMCDLSASEGCVTFNLLTQRIEVARLLNFFYIVYSVYIQLLLCRPWHIMPV